MARSLYLYSGIAPNRDGQTHYIYVTISNYLSQLALHREMLIDFPNYRITEGRVLISIGSYSLSLAKSQKISYIIDCDTSESYIRCYHVVRAYDKSGYAVFDVELDKWGTYIKDASISHTHITRCNREIAPTGGVSLPAYEYRSGVYDDVQNTSTETIALRSGARYALTDVDVIFELSYNVSQGLFGNDQLTKNTLFGINAKVIADRVSAISTTFDSVDIVFRLTEFIGGIYSIESGLTSLKAKVLRMWLVPHSAVEYTNVYLGATIFSKSPVSNMADVSITNVYIVKPCVKVRSFLLTDMCAQLGYSWASLIPDFHVEVGGYYNGLPITRYTSLGRVTGLLPKSPQAYVNYRFVYTTSEVSVFVEYANATREITKSFEVAMTSNNATDAALTQISNYLGKTASGIAGIAAGAVAGAAAGSVPGAIAGAGIGALTFGKSLIGSLRSADNLGIEGTGDGALSWSINSATEFGTPYFVMARRSIIDEKQAVYYNGAKFDVWDIDLSLLTGYTHLGSISAAFERVGTFVVVDKAEIKGLNIEAENFVRSELARGVWVYGLT